MVRIRRFEERCVELYSAAEDPRLPPPLHRRGGGRGRRDGGAGPDDAVVATYREHGHALARGVRPPAVMAEMFGKVEGCSRGRGGSMHLFDRRHPFYGGNAIVGGGLPLAVGLALADRLRDRPHVTACFFGEGAVAEGEFHESMNLAALWRLPVLFCCENNLYAMGTALERSEAETDLALRAAGYGMPAWPVDGMDVLAVDDAARRAVLESAGRRAGVPGAADLPVPGALDVRPRALPRQGRGRRLARARPDLGLLLERLRADDGLLADDDLAAIEARGRRRDRRGGGLRRGRHARAGRGPDPVRLRGPARHRPTT